MAMTPNKVAAYMRFSLSGLTAMFLCISAPFFVFAQSPIQKGFEDTSAAAGFKKDLTPEAFVGGLVQGALAILGVVFLILIVYGGVQWMVAEGDPGKLAKARGLIFHAIVGLIIVFAAYAITTFVINAIIIAAL